MSRVYPAVLAAVVSISSAASAFAQEPTSSGRWVAIGGGRDLYVDCKGSGEPVVVFEAGYGDDGSPWGQVAAKLAPAHRVCVYDRAGMGRSPSSPKPATAANITDDLHALVARMPIAKPFILVGHSRGGLYATLYALRFRSDLAGLVLVDPSFAEQDAESAAISPAQAQRMAASIPRQRATFDRCAALAEAKALTPDKPQGCFSLSPGMSSEARGETLRQSLRPSYYRTLRSEFDATMDRAGYGVITSAAAASARPLGDLPLVVLTAGKPHQQGGTADDAAASAVWSKGHDRLAAYSAKGRSITIPGTSHYIQEDSPGAVADAIRSILPPTP